MYYFYTFYKKNELKIYKNYLEDLNKLQKWNFCVSLSMSVLMLIKMK